MNNLHKAVLSILLTTSLSFATNISTTEATYYDSNMQHVAVNINGILSGDKDWVGIYKKDDNNDWGNVVAWSWVEDKKSNLHMNTKRTIDENHAARYEARLFFHNSYKVEARAPFLYIPMSPPPSNFPRFPINTFNPILYEGDRAKDIGISLNVEISGNKDWIGIYKKGDNNNWSNVIDWAWVKKDGTVDTFKRDAKLSKGDYNIRLFFNNSYDVEWSNNILVLGTTNPPIKTLKDTYKVNETISVTVDQSQLTGKDDRVGVYRKSDKQEWDWGVVRKYSWTPESRTYQLTEGDKDLPAGEYEIRLYTDFSSHPMPKAKYSFRIVNNTRNRNKKYPKTMQAKDIPLLEKNIIPKPTKGESVIDDILGTKITQVNKGDNYISAYPKVQSWNKDMSLLRIGYRIYDGHTYAETDITKDKSTDQSAQKLCSGNSAYMRWSNKDSKKFYLTQNAHHKLIKGEIKGNEVKCTTLDAFDGYDTIYMTLEEGNIDYNDQYVVMLAKKVKDQTMYIVKYDLTNEKREWVKPLAIDDDSWVKNWIYIDNKRTQRFYWMPKNTDWISISPSGKYIVRNNARGGGNTNYVYVYDKNLNHKTKLTYKNKNNNSVPIKGEHGDIGIDSKGNDVWVQFIYDDVKGGVYMFNLAKPNELGQAITTSNFGGGHIGCHNNNRTGWCTISPYDNRYNHVFSLKLRALKDIQNENEKENVQVFSKMYRVNKYHDTFAGASPDGTKVIFNSKWGTDKVGTFIAEVK